jgi:hypothetical protein
MSDTYSSTPIVWVGGDSYNRVLIILFFFDRGHDRTRGIGVSLDTRKGMRLLKDIIIQKPFIIIQLE